MAYSPKTPELVTVPVQHVHGLITPTEPILCPETPEEYFPSALPQDTQPDIRQQTWLNAKLQLSSLLDSFKTASLADDKGFWVGDQEDESMRLELLDMCLKLQKTLSSPMDMLQNIAQAHHLEATLRYAVCNNLAQLIPTTTAIAYSALAANAAVNERQCKRLLRLLISHHIFEEPVPNTVAHTPSSLLLLDPNVQAWIEYSTTDSLKGSTCLTEALQQWSGSAHKSETAFSLAHNTKLPMFEYFERTPGKLSRFRKAMTAMARQPGISPRHVTAGYPWQDLEPEAMIVDVGGGCGHVASAIVDANPSLQATVQDLGVEATHTEGSITFSKYDFFQPQPVQNADVYILRQVLHDWSDDYAVQILRNQVAVMGERSKLVVMEKVMPRPGEWSLLEERRSRTNDVTMLTLFNAQEREIAEWLALVQKADSRLQLTRIARPPGSLLSMMEFSLM